MQARLNPFASCHINSLFYIFPEQYSWEDLILKISILDYRAAIIGPRGSGKTTLMEQLGSHFEDMGIKTKKIRLSLQKQSFSQQEWYDLKKGLAKDIVIFLDGAELMSWLDWFKLKRLSLQAKGLIITSHDKKLLPVLIHCHPHFNILKKLLFVLIGDESQTLLPEAEKLYYQHEGNIRDVLRDLYEKYASL